MIYTKEELDDLVYKVKGACIEVHRELGPGLLESVYHKCLKIEFDYLGISYNSETPLEIIYRGQEVDLEFRCDFIIEKILILEIKSVKEFLPIFDAQVLTYMHITDCPKGLLINFNVKNIISQGYKAMVNNLYYDLD